MADEESTLDILVEELGLALDPLIAAFDSADAFRDFLEDLGWDFNAVPAALDALRTPIGQASTGAQNEITAGQRPDMRNRVQAAFEAISTLGGAGGLPAEFANEFPRQLVDYLLVTWLLRHQPRVGYALILMGIVRLEEKPATATRPAYLQRKFAFEDLGAFFQNPIDFWKTSYRWGQSSFDGERLIDGVYGLFNAWDWRVRQELLDPVTLQQLSVGALDPASVSALNLRLVLFEQATDLLGAEAGVGLFLLPETASAKPGLSLLPYARGELDVEIPLSELLTLGIKAGIDLSGGVGVNLRPDKDIEFFAGLAAGTPSAVSGNVSALLRLAEQGGPVVVIGAKEQSRLEFGTITTEAGTRFHSGGKFEVFTEFNLQDGKIVVKPSEEDKDGFIAKLLPAEGLELGIKLTVGFSTTRGVYFGGSGGLEITIPTHITLGPVEITSALVGVKFKDGKIPVDLAATIKADLSVIKGTVENIGLTATFSFPPDRNGNLGPVNLALGFRPPNGVGLAIDAGVVKGGGYLFLDFDKGEYAGALELTIANFLSLKAIGLINTKMPDGTPGFSLLIIITVEFVPGFQLGYGFTLIGVGGLVGLNRAVLLDPLARGVRTGAVNSILFPTNIIANAPKILSDLRAIFPPVNGKFLIGPMAKIGWGTPTLISVSLGVIIEIPGNVVILGRLAVALPTADDPVLLLQLTFIGALEFDKRRLWFFASLFDSRILFITIDGEMGLLVDYSDNPNFVLSVGGFHPQLKAPPLPFPTPNRIALNIINESYARVRAEAYFAITTNSVQFGTKAELYFGFDALTVEGYFSFDALLRFSPLYFEVVMATGFSVKVFGLGLFSVHLRGSLTGPQPWHIKGSASIELLFFSIGVDVDVTFGDEGSVLLPPIALLPPLLEEFKKAESWVAELPASSTLLTTLRKLDEANLLVLHPVGVLRVSQRMAPLNVELKKVGNQATSDVQKVRVEISGGPLSVRDAAREMFARGQYQELSDADKLSKPAFESMEGGVRLAGSGADWAAGVGADRNVRYESIVVDRLFERFARPFYEWLTLLFVHFRAGSAVTRSALSYANEKKRQPFAEKVVVNGDSYVVAFTKDNTSVGGSTVFASRTEAEQFMAEHVAEDPALRRQVHVIPAMERNLA
jgi:Family of unknown function (DUF6603)